MWHIKCVDTLNIFAAICSIQILDRIQYSFSINETTITLSCSDGVSTAVIYGNMNFANTLYWPHVVQLQSQIIQIITHSVPLFLFPLHPFSSHSNWLPCFKEFTYNVLMFFFSYCLSITKKWFSCQRVPPPFRHIWNGGQLHQYITSQQRLSALVNKPDALLRGRISTY